MAELLLNWAVVLGTLAALVLIAYWSYRDLLGRSQVSGLKSQVPSAPTWDLGHGTPDPDEEPEAQHRLRVEYHRNGHAEHTQWVTDERPGFIGTEALPGMGAGILVRHVRLAYEGDGFTMENRHGSKPLLWRADHGRSGELAPGERLPIQGEVDVALGEWIVTCREEE